MAVVPLLHQFEEDVALLGLQGQIPKFKLSEMWS